MNTESAITFLQYLREKAELISQQEVINKHDIIDLMRDLQKLREESLQSQNAELKQAIRNLNIPVRKSYLHGGWRNFLLAGFFSCGPFHSQYIRQKSGTEAATKYILDFRNQVSHLLFRIKEGLPLQ